jgi:hypothetical protein
VLSVWARFGLNQMNKNNKQSIRMVEIFYLQLKLKAYQEAKYDR